jgi:hypothetical protein
VTLTVEDGTGKPDADSYNDLAGVTALLAERGLVLPAGTTAENEAAARSATWYLDGTYDFVGKIQYPTQALDWPRIYAYDHEWRPVPPDTVPVQVLRAHAFLTYQARLGDLQVVEEGTGGTAAGGVSAERVKVGPIEKETSFFQASTTGAAASQKRFVEVETLLGGLLARGPGRNSTSIVRWS